MNIIGIRMENLFPKLFILIDIITYINWLIYISCFKCISYKIYFHLICILFYLIIALSFYIECFQAQFNSSNVMKYNISCSSQDLLKLTFTSYQLVTAVMFVLFVIRNIFILCKLFTQSLYN